VESALKNAPSVLEASASKEYSSLELKQASKLGNPVLTYQGGSLDSGGSRGSINDITLNQPIPWYGKRSARIQTQEFLLKASEMERSEAVLALAHRVFVLCAQIAAYDEIEKHHDERKKRFLFVQKYFETRPLASPKLSVDKDLIEVQYQMLEKSIVDLAAMKLASYRELEILTGVQDPKVSFRWDLPLTLVDRSVFIEKIKESPELRKLSIMGSASRSRVEEARYEARPDIMVGVNYRREAVEPVNNFYHAQVSVVLPIVDTGENKVQSARAEVRRTEAQNKVREVEVLTEIHKSYESLVAALKNAKIFRYERIKETEQKFKRAEAAFKKGQVDISTFLETDEQIHETINEVFLSRMEYYTHLSRLQFLTGQRPEL
jgi:outer membrane protein TolC